VQDIANDAQAQWLCRVSLEQYCLPLNFTRPTMTAASDVVAWCWLLKGDLGC
jgi:hypothetical protein